MAIPQYTGRSPHQCDHWFAMTPVFLSLRGSVSDRGNPHLSDPSGVGRRNAPQGLRIATSGFALLAMTW